MSDKKQDEKSDVDDNGLKGSIKEKKSMKQEGVVNESNLSKMDIVDDDDERVEYKRNEKVLCYHLSMLYEAKIEKVDKKKKNGKFYRVHYMQWNKRYDEWVAKDRLMKLNKENIEVMVQHNDKIASANNVLKDREEVFSDSDAKSTASFSSHSTDVKDEGIHGKKSSTKKTVRTKRKRNSFNNSKAIEKGNATEDIKKEIEKQKEPDVSDEEVSAVRKKAQEEMKKIAQEIDITEKDYMNEPPFKKKKCRMIELSFPSVLIELLKTDKEKICIKNDIKKKQAPENIDSILNDFLLEVKQNISSNQNTQEYEEYELVIDGIKSFLNKSCKDRLLYSNERKVYRNIIKRKGKNFKGVEYFGMNHLLRFLCVFPSLLCKLNLEEETIDIIETKSKTLIEYLERKAFIQKS